MATIFSALSITVYGSAGAAATSRPWSWHDDESKAWDHLEHHVYGQHGTRARHKPRPFAHRRTHCRWNADERQVRYQQHHSWWCRDGTGEHLRGRFSDCSPQQTAQELALSKVICHWHVMIRDLQYWEKIMLKCICVLTASQLETRFENWNEINAEGITGNDPNHVASEWELTHLNPT